MGSAVKKVAVHMHDRTAVGLYRCLLPVRACAATLAAEGVELKLVSDLTAGDEFDAVVVHRDLTDKAISVLYALRKRGTKIAWDTDDDLNRLPPWNCNYGDRVAISSAFNHSRAAADVCWAATPHLGKLVNADAVLPNLIDPALFGDDPLPPKAKDARVSILWAGGSSHRGDLEVVEDALDAVLTDFRGKVVVAFLGGTFPGKLAAKWYGDGVTLIDAVPMHDYFRTLRMLQPDIGIAPLADHPFNLSKSNAKYLEYTLAGAATMLSRGPAYTGSWALFGGPHGNESGRRSTGDWTTWLRELCKSTELRSGWAEKASEHVLAEYAIPHGRAVSLWLQAFRELVR